MAAAAPQQPWTYKDILFDVIRLKHMQFINRDEYRIETFFKPFHRNELTEIGNTLGARFDLLARDRRGRGRYPQNPLAPNVPPRQETKKMLRVASRVVFWFHRFVQFEENSRRALIADGQVPNWVWRQQKNQELLSEEISKFARRLAQLDREEGHQQEQERQPGEVEVIRIDADGEGEDEDDDDEAEDEEDEENMEELEIGDDFDDLEDEENMEELEIGDDFDDLEDEEDEDIIDEEEDYEDEEEDEEDDKEEEGVNPIRTEFNRIHSLYQNLHQLMLNNQLERSARGLPVEKVHKFDQVFIWQTLIGPDGQELPLILKNFWKELERIYKSFAGEKPKNVMEKPLMVHRRPGEFQLPEHVRNRLKTGEVQVIESSIDLLRDALVKGTGSPRKSRKILVRKIGRISRMYGGTNALISEGALANRTEIIVKTDDYKRRKAAYLERLKKAPVIWRQKLRKLEAQSLYVPHIPGENWRFWTEQDISDWIKFFVPLQAHRDKIEVQRFTGRMLNKFLLSKEKWHEAGWPFGLYIQVRSHFNRVVNHIHGYVHRYR